MQDMSKESIQAYHIVKVIDKKLAEKVQDYRLRLSTLNAGYSILTDWHPVIPQGWGEFSQAPVRRATIYQGNAQTWAYSHHQTIAKFGNKFVTAWSNGFLHEDYVGQEVHCAWSNDGLCWSEPTIIAPTPVESGLVRNNAGLYADGNHLFCYVGVAKDFGRDKAPPGMFSFKEPHFQLDVYETRDLKHWTKHERICDNIYLFEGPRMTHEGKLICCGFDPIDHHGMVLIWDGPSHPEAHPRVVDISASPEGILPEQGTWYQTDDGRIWMYQRDSSISCRLGLTWSVDGGETWSELLRTDFPNSYSRAFAGRLNDGRFFIVGNNYDILLDRRHLLIALSDNGRIFDRQWTLVEGNTTRHINGRHKEDGFHYPNCLCDGDNLIVVYSVNKEDIEVCIVDMSHLS